MKAIICGLLTVLFMAGCSSSAPAPESSDSAPMTKSAPAAKATSAPAAASAFTPAKPMKCTYDTDCMVQNPCVNDKCKLSGAECRFRSDCPKPRGTCVNKVCQFN